MELWLELLLCVIVLGVGVKLFIVLFVIFAGIQFINRDNWSPFIPPSQPGKAAEGLATPLLQVLTGMTPATYGVMGIMAGAAIVFFAYIGFDVVATTAEEARNPQRDLPRGIIGSLVICTVLYVAVTLVITGMQNYKEIDPKAALATAFTHVGKDGFATLISAGAVAGLTTVVMTLIIGATRVTFAMSRDHLIPATLGRTNPKTGTPVKLTLIIGGVVALIASLTPIGKLEEMVNIGTLTAFMLVSLAVPILRKRRPDLKRSFKVPGNPFVPWLSAAACFYLVLNLSIETWIRFVVWMALGFLIYFSYSRHHSKLATGEEEEGSRGAPEVLSERGPATPLPTSPPVTSRAGCRLRAGSTRRSAVAATGATRGRTGGPARTGKDSRSGRRARSSRRSTSTPAGAPPRDGPRRTPPLASRQPDGPPEDR
jgi:APA family basic amino acid/polyamine antiporter